MTASVLVQQGSAVRRAGAAGTMAAVVVDRYGPPDVLRPTLLPRPVPGPGQVRVRTVATGVHPTDAATRAGRLAAWVRTPFPFVLGWDVAGVVDSVGPGVTGWRPGDPVLGLWDQLATGTGSYAQFVVLDAGVLAPAPRTVPLRDAAALPLSGVTALDALDALALPPGATVLIGGAAGMVGGFALRLARHRGLHVVAVVRSASGRTAALRLGATEVLTADDLRRRSRPFADGVLDTVGLPELISAVRDGGEHVTVVPGSEPPAGRGIRTRTYLVEPSGERLRCLVRLVDAGALSPRVAGVLPLLEAPAAHRRLEADGVPGRLLLVP